MKIRISDMMDQMECMAVDMQECNRFSSQQVREKTLQKIHNASTEYNLGEKIFRMGRIPKAGKIPKVGIAIGALVLAISTTATAGVIMKWSGFVYTDGLNRQEKEALMKEAGTVCAAAVNEIDGSVHYLDKDGNEIMVLSAEEAAEYEAARKEAAEQTVVESTSLIDVSTMPLIPVSITEIETVEDGKFADFMLGNGHMVLLHPAGEDGYRLAKGDTVTITMDLDNECYLTFGVYRNGNFVGEELFRMPQHCYQFTAEEDGLYQFSVSYGSIGAGMFTDCSIMVDGSF